MKKDQWSGGMFASDSDSEDEFMSSDGGDYVDPPANRGAHQTDDGSDYHLDSEPDSFEDQFDPSNAAGTSNPRRGDRKEDFDSLESEEQEVSDSQDDYDEQISEYGENSTDSPIDEDSPTEKIASGGEDRQKDASNARGTPDSYEDLFSSDDFGESDSEANPLGDESDTDLLSDDLDQPGPKRDSAEDENAKEEPLKARTNSLINTSDDEEDIDPESDLGDQDIYEESDILSDSEDQDVEEEGKTKPDSEDQDVEEESDLDLNTESEYSDEKGIASDESDYTISDEVEQIEVEKSIGVMSISEFEVVVIRTWKKTLRMRRTGGGI